MSWLIDALWHDFRALPREAVVAAMATLGLLVGSFLNVVVCRVPRMLERQWSQEAASWSGEAPPVAPTFNLAWPPSRCPRCETRIAARHNVPVLGFVFLRGRCAYCRTGISLRYPLVELSCGVMFAIVAWHFVPSMQYLAMLAWCGFGATLLALALIDIDTRLLPDALTLPLLWAGLLGSVAGLTLPIDDAVLGAALGYGVMAATGGAYRALTGIDGLGGGDAKLAAACGAWLGWIGTPLMLAFGAVAATLAFAALGAWRGRATREPLPFGPWLCLGAVASLLWGEPLLNLWLRPGG
ncbi:prepilin peptidase [Pandoraea terrigena]|uniref:Prepilin leader peptidase/N-methyltransferase n=1 Tax=Pandoraea terrigena TaxID=2508292 RepID=A0A5E4RQ79_9BURK|nr:A24 family peptidase [Pandoraea terrigena]VVD64028.1 type IV pilus prepilin peptidase PilD [Pandoraea terrigena]